MKGYLRVTAAIYALVALWHVYELIHHLERAERDPGFVSGVVAVILVAGGLAFWGVRLLRGARDGTAG
jgi:hypothetical protein